MTVIIDYHTGNIGSIKNMLSRLGHPSVISNLASDIESASHIILPGVGSFDYGMNKLKELDLLQVLNKKVLDNRIPVLGICLGAQLMCQNSEEGDLRGLGWIDGEVKRFPSSWNGEKNIVPHMGWERVDSLKPTRLFAGLQDPRFYFAQSYYIRCSHENEVLAQNNHGPSFHSAFEKGNVIGVQFHPEKSHTFGKHLLNNFISTY